MPRPRKQRRLARPPRPAIYKPAGIPLDELRRVMLLHEELEALRLADLEALSQEESAGRMGISRSTFQRILSRARRQVAMALVQGCALEVQGGTFEVVGESHPSSAHRTGRHSPGSHRHTRDSRDKPR